ncbi:SDR family NAD(P)-dependent oxidoreductase [Actinopolymorpha pittospori]
MPKSIAVFGTGPGLGQAVAHRYAREGYAVVLVARRRQPLEDLAGDLTGAGATVHVLPTDLSEPSVVPGLAERIRAQVGDPDVLYYGPSVGGFVPATTLTPKYARDTMPLGLYTLLALVQEFLPPMVERGHGAILTAQGASAVHGWANMSGTGPVLAARRNYLQSLHQEVSKQGVYVGSLHVGAAIEHTPFHAAQEEARAAGTLVAEVPTVDPGHLADLLWGMHHTKGHAEVTYPDGLIGP